MNVFLRTLMAFTVFLGLFFSISLHSEKANAACINPAAAVGEIMFDSGFDHCFKGCTDDGWDMMTDCRDPFVSTWNTANTSAGSSNNDQVKLPLVNGGTYNFTVDWGDGSIDTITTWNQAETTHTYGAQGSYTIVIKGTITGWRFNNTGDRLKITNISSWGPIMLGNSNGYFSGATNLTITATNLLNTTGTTNMQSAFYGASSLSTVPNMDQWDMSAVTNMTQMFRGATNFNQNISGWDVGSVTSMASMFFGASAFNQPIGAWNVSSVTNMSYMFYQASAFNQNINGWNVGSVTNMSYMFGQTPVFNQSISGWNVSSVTNMSGMFFASAFNQNINGWNVSSVTNMSSMFVNNTVFNQPLNGWNMANVLQINGMFSGATAFNQPIGAWNVSSVTNMYEVFRQATAFNQDISTWNTSSVTNMNFLFYQATSFNQPIGTWNTANVTSMQSMFYQASAFNQDISNWNISNVTSMQNMFGSSGFSSTNYNNLLCGWTTRPVQPNVQFHAGTAQYGLATERAVLTGAPNSWIITDGGAGAALPGCPDAFVTTWNTTNTSAGSSAANQITLPLVISGTYNFKVFWGDGTSDTITAWNQAAKTHTYAAPGAYTITIRGTFTGFRFANSGDRLKLTNISQFGTLRLGNSSAYFQGASNLTITATDVLDMTGTTTMANAFTDCTSLTTVPSMNSWDMSAVTNMTSMFQGATSFNQALNSWNTANVLNMANMFRSATAFNGNITTWNTIKVTNMSSMFQSAVAFNQNINGWNTVAVTNMTGMFQAASIFNQSLNSWNTAAVTTMNQMFYQATAFNGNIGSWNTAAVTTMNSMFYQATAFNQNIGSWNTAAVTNMLGMFRQATAFNQNIGSWNTAAVTTMNTMFYLASAFNQPIGTWNTAAVTNMASMFQSASAFNQNLGNWNISNVTTMANMFLGSALNQTNYQGLLCGWVTRTVQPNVAFHGGAAQYGEGGVVAARNVFTTAPNNWTITDGGSTGGKAACPNTFISGWDTNNTSAGSSGVNQIALPLHSAGSYNFIVFWGDNSYSRITAWNQAAVTHTYAAPGEYTIRVLGTITGFRFANTGDRLKLESIAAWGPLRLGNANGYFHGAANMTITATDILDMTGTTTMQSAFNGTTALTTVPNMGSWNMSAVTNMLEMFRDATSFNQDISGWNVSSVTTMQQTFLNNTLFNQNIGAWNTASLTNMDSTFRGAAAFNQNISGWNTANVTTFNGTFLGATAFNQNISGWNTANVTTMNSMFNNATAFNQNLGAWNVSNVTNMFAMFTGSGLTRSSYNGILCGWSSRPVKPNVPLSTGPSYDMSAARAILTSAPNNWAITDGGSAGDTSC